MVEAIEDNEVGLRDSYRCLFLSLPTTAFSATKMWRNLRVGKDQKGAGVDGKPGVENGARVGGGFGERDGGGGRETS